MADKTSQEKKRGRPRAEGPGTSVNVRLSNADLRLLDDWRREQEDMPNRPEAIRRLVKRALAEK
jgi:hypothetical protein